MARELRTNEYIRAREVLLIGGNGERLGVMPVAQALDIARKADLDLVEVAPNVDPPVCRVLDYGKYKYAQSKKERDARKHQHHVVLREVRFKPKIGSHDVDFKARTAEKLLREGDKVKVSVMFRGRELTHPQIGRDLLDRIYDKLKEIAILERPPTMEGRFMSMILTPLPPKQPGRQPKEPGGGGAGAGGQHGDLSLPKLKTHKGVKRRFHVTGSGKIMQPKGNRSHLRRRKSRRAKALFSEMMEVHPTARQRLRRLLPYGRR